MSSRLRRGDRWGKIHLAVLLLVATALWLPRLHGPIDLRWDAGVYYVLGLALADGKGYRLLNEPGDIEAIQYPPALAAVAAIHERAAGTAELAVVGRLLRRTFFALTLAYAAAVYLMARRFLAPPLAFLTALITLLQFDTTWLTNLFFAEIPFALTTTLFVLALRPGAGRGRRALAGGLAIVAYLFRSIGLALLVAWVAESALRRRFRQAVVRLLIALVPIVAWQAHVVGVKASPEYERTAYPYQRAAYQFYNVGYLENLAYVDSFAPERGRVSTIGLAQRLGDNLLRMPLSWGEALTCRVHVAQLWLARLQARVPVLPLPPQMATAFLWLLAVLAAGGLLSLARRGEWLIPLYVAASVGLIALTPWPAQFHRYLAPLTPLLALSLVWCLVQLVGWVTRAIPTARMVSLVAAAGLLAGVLVTEALALYELYTGALRSATYADEAGRVQEYRLFYYDADWRTHDQALAWLKGHSPPDAVVATATPQWAYVNTGRRAVMPPFETDVRRAQALLDAVPVQYLVVDSLGEYEMMRRYALPVARAFPERWRLVHASPDGVSRIYERTAVDRNSRAP